MQTRLLYVGEDWGDGRICLCMVDKSSSRKPKKTKTMSHNRKLSTFLCVYAACANLVDALNLSDNYGHSGKETAQTFAIVLQFNFN